ncbi:MAG: lysoplasmalogenase [Candidatus Hermodarchaeota archaeon]|nr:lysoplasmalogenase [Candidatus Hermodarchaeota archaeon]
MLHLIIYGLLFWLFATISAFLKAVREDELAYQTERIKNLPKGLFIAIKVLPALISVIIIVVFRPSGALFYILLAVALVFCALGDVGMETKFLAGVLFFLIAHLFLTANFLWHSYILGVSLIPLLSFVISYVIMIFVIIYAVRFLDSSEPRLGPLKIPLLIYVLILSLTLSSSLILWITIGNPLGVVPFIGAIIFVISDLLIGIRLFHHHFNKAEFTIFSTYYLAIFLLTLSFTIYLF